MNSTPIPLTAAIASKFSLLAAGALQRLMGAIGLVILLWLAVAWALHG